MLKRKPTTPGEILLQEFLKPLGLTQANLAKHIGCDYKVINRIINGGAAVTTEVALKLGATFKTSPEFWINSQVAVDTHKAAKKLRKLPKPIVTSPAQESGPIRLVTAPPNK